MTGGERMQSAGRRRPFMFGIRAGGATYSQNGGPSPMGTRYRVSAPKAGKKLRKLKLHNSFGRHTHYGMPVFCHAFKNILHFPYGEVCAERRCRGSKLSPLLFSNAQDLLFCIGFTLRQGFPVCLLAGKQSVNPPSHRHETRERHREKPPPLSGTNEKHRAKDCSQTPTHDN